MAWDRSSIYLARQATQSGQGVRPGALRRLGGERAGRGRRAPKTPHPVIQTQKHPPKWALDSSLGLGERQHLTGATQLYLAVSGSQASTGLYPPDDAVIWGRSENGCVATSCCSACNSDSTTCRNGDRGHIGRHGCWRSRNTIGIDETSRTNGIDSIDAIRHRELVRRRHRQRFCEARFLRVFLIRRQRNRRQDADDRDHDHQFDQGETFLHALHENLSRG